ncbi:PepSY domain-containing protein [Oceanisphaera ostreae]|uniref:PepSY domain-containing protein n=1 Tax=Oceanisphaera ostreae TaxID=914151 RepID=A0ABW3KLA1_9GAMM
MLRKFHSISAWLASLLLLVLTLSGALLSLAPAIERSSAELAASQQLNVAELANRIAQHYPQVEQIERRPSGGILVYYQQANEAKVYWVSPATGQALAPYQASAFFRWLKNLHRSFLLDTPGRLAAGAGAFMMLVLSVSGTLLLARQQGGIHRLLRPLAGSGSKRWHAELARVALLGLLLSAPTGLYLSTVTFELVPEGIQADPEPPQISLPLTPQTPIAPIASLAALQATPVSELEELIYPYPNDPTDVYSLRTHQGASFVNPYSGEQLAYQAHDKPHGVYALITKLHTGEGLWWLGLWLGLSALAVPVLAVTGLQTWWQRRKAMPKLLNNSQAKAADTVILVGSEANSTWGFARTLHDALTAAGHAVHTAPMNSVAAHYPQAKQLLVLTATYGDGDAPASADHFLSRLRAINQLPIARFAVLGFGDQQFCHFCRFAEEVDTALLARGGESLLALETIDRQSAQTFARWGTRLGEALGHELVLEHKGVRVPTTRLQLVDRVDYDVNSDTPTSVLRFAAMPNSRKSWSRLSRSARLPHFAAGDLVGIYAPHSTVARLYSLACASSDGVLEICVRKHAGGECSSFLHHLQLGEPIDVFIQPHPTFRPLLGDTPLILVGAGTGIGPLVGFIRNNQQHRPIHLYWGGRDPQADFLYETELQGYLADGRLTQLHAAFSRVGDRSYVQHRITANSEPLQALIAAGAQVLVCGGRNMATSVAEALDQLLAPLELNVQTLKTAGRYREDVY